jgi:hypothetical protein
MMSVIISLLCEGIPFYNDLRQAYGLPRRTFDQITRDPTIVSLLRQVYNDDVDKVDAFVGGLAEGLLVYLSVCLFVCLSFIACIRTLQVILIERKSNQSNET